MYFKVTHSSIYSWKGSGTEKEQKNPNLMDSFCHLIIAQEATTECPWVLLIDQGDDTGILTTNCVEYIIPRILYFDFSFCWTLCLRVAIPLPIQSQWKITSLIVAKDVISRFVSLQILEECSCGARAVGMNSIPISNSLRKSWKVVMVKNLPREHPPKGLRLLLRLLYNFLSRKWSLIATVLLPSILVPKIDNQKG